MYHLCVDEVVFLFDTCSRRCFVWYDKSGMKSKNVTIQITSGTIVLALFYLLIAWFLYEIRDILLIVISAIIFSMGFGTGKALFLHDLRCRSRLR